MVRREEGEALVKKLSEKNSEVVYVVCSALTEWSLKEVRDPVELRFRIARGLLEETEVNQE